MCTGYLNLGCMCAGINGHCTPATSFPPEQVDREWAGKSKAWVQLSLCEGGSNLVLA